MKYLLSSLVAIGLFSGAAYSDGPLTSKLEAYLVTTDEAGTETLTPTEEIAPGEMIEYVLTYENISDAGLSGLVISAPVPATTEFVEDSAATSVPSLFEVSIDDGKSWSTPPIVIMTDMGEQVVAPAEYDMVRWQPGVVLEGQSLWTFRYRTLVQ